MTNSKYQYDDYYANNKPADFKPIDLFNSDGVQVDFEQIVADSEARVAASIKNPAIVLSAEELAKIEEIRYLLDTALARALHRDGHSKSSEGAIGIELGNYWERMEAEEDGTRPEVGLNIYSYNLGPSRQHYFGSIDRALETVRVWYAREMSLPEEYEPWDGVEDTEALESFEKLMSKIEVIELPSKSDEGKDL